MPYKTILRLCTKRFSVGFSLDEEEGLSARVREAFAACTVGRLPTIPSAFDYLVILSKSILSVLVALRNKKLPL